jgi:hypothetical protein
MGHFPGNGFPCLRKFLGTAALQIHAKVKGGVFPFLPPNKGPVLLPSIWAQPVLAWRGQPSHFKGRNYLA